MRPGDHRPSDRNYSRFGRRVFLALPDAGLSIGAERLVLSRKGLFEREKSGATQFGSEFFRTLNCDFSMPYTTRALLRPEPAQRLANGTAAYAVAE